MELNGPAFEREVKRPMSTAQMLAAVLPQAARKRQGSLSTSVAPGPMKVSQRQLRFEAARQQIALYEPLRPGDEVNATTELEALRETPRGYELDFSMSVERNGRPAWSGVATLLSRSAAARSGRTRNRGATPRDGGIGFEVTVPGNTGVRYARVSGDYNPHHLWWFTARPFGYRRPIAHGMWTFARVLSEVLEGVDEDAPVDAGAAFKRPLLMPSRIRIEAQRLTRDLTEVEFAVREAKSGAPHVTGVAAYSS